MPTIKLVRCHECPINSFCSVGKPELAFKRFECGLSDGEIGDAGASLSEASEGCPLLRLVEDFSESKDFFDSSRREP